VKLIILSSLNQWHEQLTCKDVDEVHDGVYGEFRGTVVSYCDTQDTLLDLYRLGNNRSVNLNITIGELRYLTNSITE
jgi:hypothetical protein